MKRNLLLFIAMLGLFGQLHAQWSQVTGMYGGDVRCLKKIGNDIYAGSHYGGIFRSSDQGENWTGLFNGLVGNVAVTNIIKVDTVLYLGTSYWSTSGKGVFRSYDNGASWSTANTGFGIAGSFNDLNITGLISCSNYLFAATKEMGLYRSVNQGTNWTHAGNDTIVSITTLCNLGNTIFLGTEYFGTYRSNDFGETWTSINTGFPAGAIVYGLIASGTNLYARTSHGFYWSPSNGDYWISINTGISQPNGAAQGALTADGAIMYASTFDSSEGPRTYKSVNGGSTWTEITPLSSSYFVEALLIDGNNVYAGNIGNYGMNSQRGGVVRSTDNGASWAPASNGISGLSCTAVTSDETRIYAGTRYYSGIYNSTDNGATWNGSFVPGTTSNYQVLSMLATGSVIYAGVYTSGVYKSGDQGQTWAATSSIGYPVWAMGANSSYIFAGTSNQGMRRSNNGGTTWTTINTGLTTTGQKSIRAIAVSGSNIYIGTSIGVYKSTNDGTNWIAANGGSGSPCYKLTRVIVVKGDTIFAGNGDGVVRSLDGGATWTSVFSYSGLATVYALYIDGETLYAGGTAGSNSPGGVYYSNDWGNTWNSLNDSFPIIPEVNSLIVKDNVLYAGTYGLSVWSLALTPPTKSLNLKLFLEGLYAGSGIMNQAQNGSGPQFGVNIADRLTVELREKNAPFNLVALYENQDIFIDGNLSITDIPATLAGEYYIVIKHRNSLETWSSNTFTFGSSSEYTYDFTTNAEKAFGNNMKQVDDKYVIWGGETTQDGIVDGSDMAAIDNASTQVLSGYYPEDINGDGIVDGSDMAVIDNNSTSVIQVMRP